MNLKPFVYKTGKPLSEIKELCNIAINEAKILGVENDERFIESTLVTMLEMNDQEYIECVRDLNKKFIDSKYSSFDDFMESLIKEDGVGVSGGDGTVSTSFSLSSRPEKLGGVTEIPNKSKKKKKEDDSAQGK